MGELTSVVNHSGVVCSVPCASKYVHKNKLKSGVDI